MITCYNRQRRVVVIDLKKQIIIFMLIDTEILPVKIDKGQL